MQKRIITYNKDVRLSKAQLEELKEAGFIPIQVKKVSDVQIPANGWNPGVDDPWLASTLLELILHGSDTEFRSSIRANLGKQILEKIEQKTKQHIIPTE